MVSLLKVNSFNFLKLENEDYILNFYRYKKYDKNKDLYLLTLDSGGFIFLNSSTFLQLRRGKIISEEVYFKLHEKGFIITENNFEDIIDKTTARYSFLNQATSLHIVILSHRCNLSCTYCFASSKTMAEDPKKFDLNEKTAKKIVEFIMKSPSYAITLEFQGGEPTVNFEMIKFMTLYAKELNLIYKKDLRLALVSNLTLMNEEKAEWLINNGVSICTSLDGPEHIHNKNRFISGKEDSKIGTYETVITWIKKINEIYLKKGMKTRVNALPTITKYSLPYYKEIIDEYLKYNIKMIDLRSLTFVGRVNQNEKLLYSHEEFQKFYFNSINYLKELEKKGIKIQNRMRNLYETKIIKNLPGFHTEFESPCGAATGQITYYTNGNIYTCNEALNRDEFKLGNVFETNWKDLFNKNETKKAILNSMIENNVICDRCVFKPYCGTCMVENYYNQNKFNFHPFKTQRHYITIRQSREIFDSILKDVEKKIDEDISNYS